jgi:hypothetical protein
MQLLKILDGTYSFLPVKKKNQVVRKSVAVALSKRLSEQKHVTALTKPHCRWSEKASSSPLSQHLSPSGASSIQKAKKEKKSGGWSCCFRPAIEEDDDKVVDRHSWGSEKVPGACVKALVRLY